MKDLDAWMAPVETNHMRTLCSQKKFFLEMHPTRTQNTGTSQSVHHSLHRDGFLLYNYLIQQTDEV